MEIERLKKVYGDNAVEQVLSEINELRQHSNIMFTEEYVKLGISFLLIKVSEIDSGKKEKCALKALVSESFGEAAIYRFNIRKDEVGTF